MAQYFSWVFQQFYRVRYSMRQGHDAVDVLCTQTLTLRKPALL